MAKPICAYCGGQAELLCDYRLGWERLRTKMRQEAPNLAVLPGYSVPLRYRQVHTCDTPLCHACAKHSGPIFICLSGAAGFSDSIDYCPDHEGYGTSRVEITGLQARLLRQRWTANAKTRWQKRELSAEQVPLF